MNRQYRLLVFVVVAVVALFMVLTQRVFVRIDMTEDLRYSISQTSKNVLAGLDENVRVVLHLTGDLDVDMTQLNKAVANKVNDISVYSDVRIDFEEVDPNAAENDSVRWRHYRELDERGMKGLSVTVQNDQGGVTQAVVFPWMEVMCGDVAIPVCLIDPMQKGSPEGAVASAMEDLEYLLVDAIRVVTSKEHKKIAFIEGHGELDEYYTYDVSETMSRYFQVDRGVIGGNVGILDDYAAIVIAGPSEKFSEADKFVIDQYVMNGGSVFWSVDGVLQSDTMLSESGLSPIIERDVNLSDMLFKYGVRITNTVLQDNQCAKMPVNFAMYGESPKFEVVDWYYAPLLMPSPYHPISKNKGEVVVEFASALEFPGVDDGKVKKDILLVTGGATRVTIVPSEIDLRAMEDVDKEEYFKYSFVPVAVVMEGEFGSVFENRMPPIAGYSIRDMKTRSKGAKMIVVADGGVMKNELEPRDGGMSVVPLGYDRASDRMYGNRDFVMNAMLYLTDDVGLMELRNRVIVPRMLNAARVELDGTYLKFINVMLPMSLLICLAIGVLIVRKRKYNV